MTVWKIRNGELERCAALVIGRAVDCDFVVVAAREFGSDAFGHRELVIARVVFGNAASTADRVFVAVIIVAADRAAAAGVEADETADIFIAADFGKHRVAADFAVVFADEPADKIIAVDCGVGERDVLNGAAFDNAEQSDVIAAADCEIADSVIVAVERAFESMVIVADWRPVMTVQIEVGTELNGYAVVVVAAVDCRRHSRELFRRGDCDDAFHSVGHSSDGAVPSGNFAVETLQVERKYVNA